MNKKNPKFCIITPTAYLEQYASQSKMHLVLAQLVDTDEEYASFYTNRKEFKIMDNGAYELGHSYDPEKLIELGQKCKADAIVLPDYPFKMADVTINAAENLIDEVRKAGFKTAFVPQSQVGELEDWIKGYDWAVNNDKIDIVCMSILGIPNALPHIPKCFARVVMAQILKERGYTFEKYHHWLGLQNISLEVPPLIDMNVIDSLDSSNPVWAGICGHQYDLHCDSILVPSKENLPHVDFTVTNDQNAMVHSNIQYNINVAQLIFAHATPAVVKPQSRLTLEKEK